MVAKLRRRSSKTRRSVTYSKVSSLMGAFNPQSRRQRRRLVWLGQIQITGDADDHPQQQGEQHRVGGDFGKGPLADHGAQDGLEAKDLLSVVEELGQAIHWPGWRVSPRRNNSAL